MKYSETIVNQFNRFKKFSTKSFVQNQKIVHYLFLLLIIFTAAVSRIYDLQNNPPALNQDEAVNGYDAYALGNTWKDHHGASFPQPMLESFSDWTSPLITYITIPFVKVFGLSEFSIRLPVAIMGVLSVLLFYILIRQILKNKNYCF